MNGVFFVITREAMTTLIVTIATLVLENNYIFLLDNGGEAVQRRSTSVRHAGAVPLAWGLRTHRHLQGV